MDEALQVYLKALTTEVQVAEIPESCRHTTAWCLGQLPTLYTKFRETNESRYVDEITRLVQGVLKELVPGKTAGPEAQKLAAGITDRLRLLHEEFGLPGLNLKSPGVPPPRSRKAG